MKKIFATFAVICLFTVGTFAGWIHSSGYAGYPCNPEQSKPGTCVWVDDEIHNRSVAPPEDSESVIKSIEAFIAENNPLDYFIN